MISDPEIDLIQQVTIKIKLGASKLHLTLHYFVKFIAS